MTLSDSNMQLAAGFGTLLFAAALIIPTTVLTGIGKKADDGPNLDDMVAMDASIAYRKTEQPKQPQKDKQAPDPTVKPDGVSHDDHKKPDPVKPDIKKDDKPVTVDDALKNFHHASDPDDAGKPVQDVGAFNGSERGFGDETKGDPYFGQLSADLHNNWEYPQILSASGTPVGCVHLSPDGKVADIKLWEKSGNDSFDDSVEHALKKVQKAREDAPVVVPSYLLPKITKWICFRFNPPTAAP